MIKEKILALSLFCISISNINKIFGVISLILLFLNIALTLHKVKEPRFKLKSFVTFCFVYIYIYIVTIFSGNLNNHFLFMHFYIFYSIFFIIYAKITLLSNDYIYDSVKYYSIVHSVFAITQLISYGFLDYYPDFFSILTSGAGQSAYSVRQLDSAFLPIRITGVFSEPSFFAMAIIPSIAYFALTENTKKPIYYFTVAMACLSLSTAALVAVTLLVLNAALFKKEKVKILPIFTIIIIVALCSWYAIDRLTDKSEYRPLEYRLQILQEFKERTPSSNIFGDGFFLDEHNSTNGVTNLSAAGVRDSGFFAYVFFAGGLIGSTLLITIICFLAGTFRKFLIISSALLMKFSILSPLFWIMVVFVIMTRNTNSSAFLKAASGKPSKIQL